MAIFVGGYLLLNRHRYSLLAKTAVFAASILAVWCANILRVAALTWFGAYVSAEWALGAFHSKAGWLLFSVIALAAVAIAEACVAKRPTATPSLSAQAETQPSPHEDAFASLYCASRATSTAQALLPLFVVSAVGLASGLFHEQVDPVYGLRVVLGATALTYLGFRWRALTSGINLPALIVGLLVFAEWLLLARRGDADAAQATGQFIAALPPVVAACWLALRILGACLVVPVVEELAFRGYLLRVLTKSRFEQVLYANTSLLAWLLSSLAFGALHASWLAGSLAGALYAALVRHTGKLEDAIVAHAVTNTALCAMVLVSGDFSYWT